MPAFLFTLYSYENQSDYWQNPFQMFSVFCFFLFYYFLRSLFVGIGHCHRSETTDEILIVEFLCLNKVRCCLALQSPDWMVFHRRSWVEHEYDHGTIVLCSFHVNTAYFQYRFSNWTPITRLWSLDTLDFRHINLCESFVPLDAISCCWCTLDRCKSIVHDHYELC